MSELVDWSPDSEYETLKMWQNNKEVVFGLTEQEFDKACTKAMELAAKEQDKVLEAAQDG